MTTDTFPVYAIDANCPRKVLVAHVLKDWRPCMGHVYGQPWCNSRVREWHIVDEKDFADCDVSHGCKRCKAAQKKAAE